MTLLLASLLVATASIIAGQHLPLIVPRWHRLLDRKPFNCRPCFTFHCLWMGLGGLAWWCGSFALFGGGIVVAFVIFFIVKYIDNKKIEK